MITRYLQSFLTMTCGTIGTLSLLIVMNQAVDPPEAQAGSAAVSFDVAAPPKPPPKRRRQKPKSKPRKQAKAPPPPMIGHGMAAQTLGVSMDDSSADELTRSLVSDQGSVAMTEETVDKLPAPVKRNPPKYPTKARSRGIRGHVTALILIDVTGRVENVTVMESEPPGVFDDSAMNAMGSWTFQPAKYEGAPVPIRVQQTLRFEFQ